MNKKKRKPILVVLLAIVALTIMLAPVVAMAAAVAGEATPYNWDYIGTIGGATAATLVIVQLLKLPLDRVWKIPTRIVVMGIAFGFMACAQAVMHGLTWPDVPLLVVNACVVALAAMGAYELTFAKAGN